jgi:site-specific DNA-methyltransferase (adenine-specific)
MKIENIKLSELEPYHNNPRINTSGIDAVANSIREFGFQQPIVVDKQMVIICGHTRYLASIRLGLEYVPVVIADSLSDDEVRAFRLVDNKTHDFAIWDNKKLNFELDGLFEFDMCEFGFGEVVFEDSVAVIDYTEDANPVEQTNSIKCPSCGELVEAE